MLLEPGATYGMRDLAGALAKGRRRNKPLRNPGPAGRAPADVVQSMVRTWRGEGLGGGREEAGWRWVRWTGPSVTLGAQGNAAPLPCLFPSSLLVAGRADPTFDPWTGDPFPGKVRAVVASEPDSLSHSCIFIVNYVFPGRMKEVRPGASVIQGKETGPHPGKGTEQDQEAHSAVAVPAGELSGR